MGKAFASTLTFTKPYCLGLLTTSSLHTSLKCGRFTQLYCLGLLTTVFLTYFVVGVVVGGGGARGCV